MKSDKLQENLMKLLSENKMEIKPYLFVRNNRKYKNNYYNSDLNQAYLLKVYKTKEGNFATKPLSPNTGKELYSAYYYGPGEQNTFEELINAIEEDGYEVIDATEERPMFYGNGSEAFANYVMERYY